MTYGMRPIVFVFASLFGVIPATALLSLPVHAEPSAPALPRIAIGEVAWAGSSRSTADEWIELWNLGSEPADISGWAIEGAAGSSPLVLPSGSTIAPRGAFVIANYASDDAHGALAIPPSLVTTAVSLPNTSLKLVLKDANGSDIDRTPDGNAPPAGSSKDPKRSMVRTSDGGWTDGAMSAGFDADVADLGTPGTCDLCAAPEASATPAPAPSGTSSSAPEAPMPEAPPPAIEPSDVAPIPPETGTIPDEGGSPTPSIPPCQPLPDTTTPMATPPATDIAPTVPIEMSTSAAAVPEPPAPPPTAVVLPADEVPTGSATATASTPSAQTVSTASTAAVLATAPVAAPAPAPAAAPIACDRLRIQEIHPNPISGQEWIELVSIDGSEIRIDGCILRDASGIIATMPMDTILAPGAAHVVALASSKLNNSGDTVSVGTADAVGDQAAFGTAPQGKSWGIVPGTASWEWMGPTPGAPNPAPAAHDPQPEAAASPQAEDPPANAPAIPATTTTSSTSPSAASPRPAPASAAVPAKQTMATATRKTVQAPKPPAAKPVDAKKTAKPKAAATHAKATKTPAATTKKATAKNPTPIRSLEPWPESFSAFMDLNPGIVVRLRGRVATPPRLVSSHAFILVAPDGRGISVSVPNSQRLPELGAAVEVVGTLSFDTRDVARLSVKSGQSIRILPNVPFPETPRAVELLAPSLEDAWSFVAASGTVLEAKGTRIRMEVDGVEISVLVKAQVGYRAARLNPGDRVRVRGVLDIGKDDPEVIVRTPDDILLIAPAPKTAASSTQAPAQTAFPGWTPLGTAVGAIGAVEGIKRVGSWRKRQRLLAAKPDSDGYANPPTIQPTATPKAIAAPPIATMRNP